MKNQAAMLTSILLCAIGLPAWARQDSTVAILVDASGSMAGFFQTGEIYRLHDRLVEATGKLAVKDYYFAYASKGRTGGLEAYREPAKAWGQITLLDRAFDDAIRKHPEMGMLWLVTDNIQDPEDSGDKSADESIRKFYEKLRGKVVKAGYFFPQLLPFRGPLYKRDGKTRLADEYDGKRALIIYALLLRDEFAGRYQALLNRFGKAAGQTYFPCKIDRESLKISEEIIDIPEAKKQHVLALKNGVLLSKQLTPFGEGEPIVAKFRVGIKSKIRNIKISRPDVQVALDEKFNFLDFGSRASDFRADTTTIVWDPPKLEYDLYPPDYEHLAGGNYVTVTIRFDRGVRFSKSLGAFLRYIFKSKAGDFKGSVRISLPVRRSQFEIVKPVLDRYGTLDTNYFEIPDERFQTKIFGLAKMFRETYDETVVFAKTYPIIFKVNYPRWPFLAIVIFFALSGLAAYALVKLQPEFELTSLGDGCYYFKRIDSVSSNKTRDYHGYTEYDNAGYKFRQDHGKVDEASGRIFKLFPFFGSQPLMLTERCGARLRRFPLVGVFAIARRNFRVQQRKRVRLNELGANLEITAETPTEPDANRLQQWSGLDDFGSPHRRNGFDKAAPPSPNNHENFESPKRASETPSEPHQSKSDKKNKKDHDHNQSRGNYPDYDYGHGY